MRKTAAVEVHPPGILRRWIERLRGRQQLLVRGAECMPLLLLSFPRGQSEAARELEAAYARTLPGLLDRDFLAPYRKMFTKLPSMVVVLLRPTNLCGCLGHHHPPGTESRLTRRLAADLGSPVGEIDLAYDAIRAWSPQPLSALAAGELGGQLPALHFEAAILAVLLHELEHLAFPEHSEKDVRRASNRLYTALMDDLVRKEAGLGYGM